MGYKRNEVETQILKGILDGSYPPGERVPSERAMADTIGHSRVTIRQAYENLTERGILVRRRGSGTIVNHRPVGHRNEVDQVAFLSTENNAFALWFAQALAVKLEEVEGLLVLRLTNLDPSLEKEAAINLAAKGISNLVFWPSCSAIDQEAFPRLRAMGVNMVFVDRFHPKGSADFIALDADHAADTIVSDAINNGADSMVFITHSEVVIDSDRHRCESFEKACLEHELPLNVVGVPWSAREQISFLIDNRESVRAEGSKAIVTVNDHVAQSLVHAVKQEGMVYAVGGSPLLSIPGVKYYKIPVKQMATTAVECLEYQSRLGPKWYPREIFVKGEFYDEFAQRCPNPTNSPTFG